MTNQPDSSPAELYGYILGELSPAERLEVEQRIASDPDLALHVERLALTHQLLRRLPEEEPPRRIAFVSDQVFEPNWFRRWWGSPARTVFAGLAMLSLAILAHAWFTRSAAVAPQPPASVAGARPADLEAIVQARVEQEVARRLEPALARAVAAVESKQQQITALRIAAAMREAEKKYALERQALLVSVEENLTQLRKQLNRFYIASAERGLQ
ncbi:MAG: hypothetical protein NZV14_12090 [Bryobacteraceae bacterium]|nr:hypothetical protein [Bryobacteraceae bacterium]MDW8378893.1 hypothetical protein [Bryobacterales bacterium]